MTNQEVQQQAQELSPILEGAALAQVLAAMIWRDTIGAAVAELVAEIAKAGGD